MGGAKTWGEEGRCHGDSSFLGSINNTVLLQLTSDWSDCDTVNPEFSSTCCVFTEQMYTSHFQADFTMIILQKQSQVIFRVRLLLCSSSFWSSTEGHTPRSETLPGLIEQMATGHCWCFWRSSKWSCSGLCLFRSGFGFVFLKLPAVSSRETLSTFDRSRVGRYFYVEGSQKKKPPDAAHGALESLRMWFIFTSDTRRGNAFRRVLEGSKVLWPQAHVSFNCLCEILSTLWALVELLRSGVQMNVHVFDEVEPGQDLKSLI